MNRMRLNYKLVLFLVALVVVLGGALLWRGTAESRETLAMSQAAEFLKANALANDDNGLYFTPLSPELQRTFAEQFRDRNGVPFFYDPWQSDGTPVRYDPQNDNGIIVYTLTAVGSERTILTAALAIRIIPDSHIDWPVRRWRQ